MTSKGGLAVGCWLEPLVVCYVDGPCTARGAWMFSWHGHWLPPESVIQERSREIPNVFDDLVLEVICCDFRWLHTQALLAVR